MKKKLISALLVTTTVLLSGCGLIPGIASKTDSDTDEDEQETTTQENTDTDTDTDTTTNSSASWNINIEVPDFPEPSGLADSVSLFPTEEGTLLKTSGDTAVVTIVDENGNIIYSESYEKILDYFGLTGIGLEDATLAAYDRGALIVETYTPSDDYSYTCDIYAVFPQEQTASLIVSMEYMPALSVYNDQLYMTYTDYTSGSPSVYETIFKQDASLCSYVQSENNAYSLTDISWFTFPTRGDNVIMSLTETLDTDGFAIGYTDEGTVMTDLDGFTEALPFYLTDIYDYDSSYIVCLSDVDGLDEYCIYDIANDVFTAVTDTSSQYLGYENGCLYYSKTDADPDGENVTHEVRMYNIYTSDDISLFYSTAAIGTADSYSNGYTNSAYIINGNIYYVDYNSTSGNWFKCNVSEDGYYSEDTGNTVFTYTWAEYGSLKSIRYETVCPYCETMVSLFTSDIPVISDEYSCADIINSKLFNLTAEHYNSFLSMVEVPGEADCEYDHFGDGADYYYPSDEEWQISGTTLLSGHYLAINMSGYNYAGGAHGMPYEDQYLFDLNTGDYIEFSDLYEGTEDELKEVVAEATKLNCEEIIANGEYYGYTPYYSDDPDEVYDEAYELVSLDSVSFEFTEEGVRVVYAPYDMGPFASGFIYVTVPYEDLGITLFN